MGTEVALMVMGKGWEMLYCGNGSGLSGQIATTLLNAGGSVKAVLVDGNEPPDVPETAVRVSATDFYDRLRILCDEADAFLVLPGGIGTLQELAHLAAWRAAALLQKQVVVYDPEDYFGPIAAFYECARKNGATRARLRDMFHVARTIKDAERHLERSI